MAKFKVGDTVRVSERYQTGGHPHIGHTFVVTATNDYTVKGLITWNTEKPWEGTFSCKSVDLVSSSSASLPTTTSPKYEAMPSTPKFKAGDILKLKNSNDAWRFYVQTVTGYNYTGFIVVSSGDKYENDYRHKVLDDNCVVAGETVSAAYGTTGPDASLVNMGVYKKPVDYQKLTKEVLEPIRGNTKVLQEVMSQLKELVKNEKEDEIRQLKQEIVRLALQAEQACRATKKAQTEEARHLDELITAKHRIGVLENQLQEILGDTHDFDRKLNMLPVVEENLDTELNAELEEEEKQRESNKPSRTPQKASFGKSAASRMYPFIGIKRRN